MTHFVFDLFFYVIALSFCRSGRYVNSLIDSKYDFFVHNGFLNVNIWPTNHVTFALNQI